MQIRTRLDRIEKLMKTDDKADRKSHFIMRYVSKETKQEAIRRYEKENGVKIDEDKDDLIIYTLVTNKEDINKLNLEKTNES